MKTHTQADIEAHVKALWSDHNRYEPVDFEITVAEGEVRLRLSAMYDPPGLSFEKLAALSEFFDTKNINDDERFSSGGCETCDWGSSYGFELVVRPDSE